MHVLHLTLVDFRSYATADVELAQGTTAFLGPNGQGKTNLVEAIDFVATQSSHRVAGSQPLIRLGCDRAVIRLTAQRIDRQVRVELELNAGRPNRARVNRGDLPRAQDALGIVRTVLFAPDDLAIVKGDPSERRRFLDDLLVVNQPRFAGVRADYERVLKQRNTLLKSARMTQGSLRHNGALTTLDAWDAQLAKAGAALLAGRLQLTAALRPHVTRAYTEVSNAAAGDLPCIAALEYRPSADLGDAKTRAELTDALLNALAERRVDELDRGLTLVGPHRDELLLTLGPLPARGYASHGESWSLALALKLGAFALLRSDGDDPVLILDDVFAELDDARRSRLAALVSGAEQVLVTAAVPADVPTGLPDARFDVREGMVSRV